jgi:hypothetical protein
MATSSVGSTQLIMADKKDSNFLVRLLTEKGNDALRKLIYNEFKEQIAKGKPSAIITHEHIITAIAEINNKENTIVEAAYPLVILVFKDFNVNTASKFDTIIKKMVQNATDYINAVEQTLDATGSPSILHNKMAAYSVEVIRKESSAEREKIFNPFGKGNKFPVRSEPSEPVADLIVPPAGPPAGSPADPSMLAPPEAKLSPEAKLPPAEKDLPKEIYTSALEQLETNLATIKKYETGTFKLDEVEDFNITKFTAALDAQKEEIKSKITEKSEIAESVLNPLIEKYIEDIKTLDKIKEVVRKLDVNSNILFFQFSILQKTTQTQNDEEKQLIAKAGTVITDIVAKRKAIIKLLVKQQNKLDSLEDSIKRSKLSYKKTIQGQLDTAYKEVTKRPPVVTTKQSNAAKEKIYDNIDRFKKTISSNLDESFIKDIKKEMLNKIRINLGTKTTAASNAIGYAKSIMNKPMYEKMLEYADDVILSEKLISYVTNIMASIQEKSLKASTLALPAGTLDILPEDAAASPPVSNPKAVTFASSIKSKEHKLIKQEEYVSMDYNTALTRFNACLEFVEKKKFLEVEIASKKNINVVQLFTSHQDTINKLIPSGISISELNSNLTKITTEFDEYLKDLTIVNKLITQILMNMIEGQQLIFIMKIKFYEEKKSDTTELLTINPMFDKLNKFSKTGIEELIEYEKFIVNTLKNITSKDNPSEVTHLINKYYNKLIRFYDINASNDKPEHQLIYNLRKSKYLAMKVYDQAENLDTQVKTTVSAMDPLLTNINFNTLKETAGNNEPMITENDNELKRIVRENKLTGVTDDETLDELSYEQKGKLISDLIRLFLGVMPLRTIFHNIDSSVISFMYYLKTKYSLVLTEPTFDKLPDGWIETTQTDLAGTETKRYIYTLFPYENFKQKIRPVEFQPSVADYIRWKAQQGQQGQRRQRQPVIAPLTVEEDEDQPLLNESNTKMTTATEEMAIKEKEYEAMKTSPTAPQPVLASVTASSPRDGSLAVSPPITLRYIMNLMNKLEPLITGLEEQKNDSGNFSSSVKSAIDEVYNKIKPAYWSFNYTVVPSNDPKVAEYKDKVPIYEELLKDVEAKFTKFKTDFNDFKSGEFKPIYDSNTTEIQTLNKFLTKTGETLEEYRKEFDQYNVKVSYIAGRLNRLQTGEKKDGMDTPRGPVVTPTAGGGGTRRGGKRFHKKTIKKNLVHKKTFKKNIVNNKIVHKKTGKNNIVKNNIVKNNIVKNKTIHKNQLKRKQTHKNN